jgi:hypothetical protein
MILVAKKSLHKDDWTQAPMPGRNHSITEVRGVLLTAGIHVRKDRVTLPPVTLWLKIKGKAQC